MKSLADREANVRLVEPFIKPWFTYALLLLLLLNPGSWLRANGEPQLVVKSLQYLSDGNFHQIVEPSIGSVLEASWSAEIRSPGALEPICAGGDVAPYKPRAKPKVMSPDYWTGGDCSALEIGQEYLATAWWTWTGLGGERQSVTYTLEFTYIGEPE